MENQNTAITIGEDILLPVLQKYQEKVLRNIEKSQETVAEIAALISLATATNDMSRGEYTYIKAPFQ